MQLRRTLALSSAVATASLVLAGLHAPANAADTVTTFTITAGNLAISAPETASLGSVATGTLAVSGPLGDVTVTDGRGSLLGNWTATADSTPWAYKTPGGVANTTYDLAKTSGTYLAGAVTSTGGGVSAGAGGVFGGSPVVAVARVGNLVGNSSATWNPTITVAPGAQAPAGTYTATITHSVS